MFLGCVSSNDERPDELECIDISDSHYRSTAVLNTRTATIRMFCTRFNPIHTPGGVLHSLQPHSHSGGCSALASTPFTLRGVFCTHFNPIHTPGGVLHSFQPHSHSGGCSALVSTPFTLQGVCCTHFNPIHTLGGVLHSLQPHSHSGGCSALTSVSKNSSQLSVPSVIAQYRARSDRGCGRITRCSSYAK